MCFLVFASLMNSGLQRHELSNIICRGLDHLFEGYFLWQHCWETSPTVSPFIVKLTAEAKSNQRTVLVKEYVKTMVKEPVEGKKLNPQEPKDR